MQPPNDHQHSWVQGINFMGEICQICQWRRSNFPTGEYQYAPPDPTTGNPVVKEAE